MRFPERVSGGLAPARVETLRYSTMPDFPGIRELDILVGCYVYVSPQRQKVLRSSEKYQAGAGGISLCTALVIPNETGQEALFVHASPDDTPSYREVEKYLADNHVTQAAAMMHRTLAYEQYDIFGLLTEADVRVQQIPIDAGNRSFEAFFDLSTGEFSAIGYDLAGEHTGQLALQQVVYRPFAPAGE
jgi:hypothetical protein